MIELYSTTHLIVTMAATFAGTALVTWALVSCSTRACDSDFKRRGARLRAQLDRIDREAARDDDAGALDGERCNPDSPSRR